MKKELKDAHIDTIKEFTQEELEAKLTQMVKDLKLSRTQQAALSYKNYLTELEIATSVEYYTMNFNSELFDNICKIQDYTSANTKASKYIVKKAKGKSPKSKSLFNNKISSISTIKDSFIIDSQGNPVISAIDTSSGTDYFNGNVTKAIAGINDQLNANIEALEKYKLLYASLSGDGNSINKNTDEYREVLDSRYT